MTNANDTTPRIYVASLSDYNAGHLHGVWIDLDGKDADEVQEKVAEMLRGSRHPNVSISCPVCTWKREVSEHLKPDLGFSEGACVECQETGMIPSAEEWAIHDHEGFGRIDVGESDSFERLVQLAGLLYEHGEAFEAWYEMLDGSGYLVDEMGEKFLEAYAGEYRSPEDWAEWHLEESGELSEVPESLRNYIDFEAYATTARLNGDVYFHEAGYGCTYVFWNH